ncbi:hypothetical protein BpHYR1_021764 [Brachionus plicatilis]|uniref:Uncharacterized protein n=1 Tax=Brachionus plicatilis TaxID=10195 RepID=A0A3M7QWK4_BRAPC|nr:hypothetical protein BpHYR1_021764 [Brachionus plicatilis]
MDHNSNPTEENGASHSPSVLSSQSSGITASESGTVSGSSSNHPLGMLAFGSAIVFGSLSSQSSGLTASGSAIFSLSSQLSGFLSFGSTISFGGFIDGLMSVSKLPELTSTRSINILNVPSGLMKRCVFPSLNTVSNNSDFLA